MFQGGACSQGTTIARDIARIRTQTLHGADVTTRGLDFSLNYRNTFGAIDFDFGANATYLMDYKFADFEFNGLSFSQGYQAAGWANHGRAPGTVSKWRGNAFASFGFDPVTLTCHVTYISGVKVDRDPPAARLEYGYDPIIGSSIGRTFKLGTKVKF